MDRISARKSTWNVLSLMRSYEFVCRFFKHRKNPPPVPSSRHHHESLIDEAEQERSRLTWPELMTAGGLAGVTAWMVGKRSDQC